MDPTTIATIIASTVAAVIGAVLAIRRRNGRRAVMPPDNASGSGQYVAFGSDDVPEACGAKPAWVRIDETLQEIKATMDDDERWCTKSDLKAVSKRLSGVEQASKDTTEAVHGLSERVAVLEERTKK